MGLKNDLQRKSKTVFRLTARGACVYRRPDSDSSYVDRDKDRPCISVTLRPPASRVGRYEPHRVLGIYLPGRDPVRRKVTELYETLVNPSLDLV